MAIYIFLNGLVREVCESHLVGWMGWEKTDDRSCNFAHIRRAWI